MEVIGVLVVPLVFKTNVGLNKVPGGFDSHSPPIDESGGPESEGSPLLLTSLLHHHQVMRGLLLASAKLCALGLELQGPGRKA
jgi:hypothetical protein